ncbi:ferritin [Marinithermus hydrothermalis]|uniref:Ferritin n=1 Tax=Marinithermus hydrothermalis (strain DSM 14884 / JCM 11576 / T1) TaxID=869210 RepID=F2NPG5_MARHT|nr:ferritin [Marinithermus hydrothermalis]AEB12246.1 Ferritin Dps family protein [Marinithermus hydrothermalis DSM 14884]
MISEKLREMLVDQIGAEHTAAQRYLAMAAYFARQGLDGWAAFFFRQSEEEREHAMRIVRFLLDVGADLTFPAVPEAQPRFASALEAVQKALAWEQEVTRSFHRMAETALAEKDYTTFQFLQWFIEEQVEEEATMGKLVQIVESGVNLFQAQAALPSE